MSGSELAGGGATLLPTIIGRLLLRQTLCLKTRTTANLPKLLHGLLTFTRAELLQPDSFLQWFSVTMNYIAEKYHTFKGGPSNSMP